MLCTFLLEIKADGMHDMFSSHTHNPKCEILNVEMPMIFGPLLNIYLSESIYFRLLDTRNGARGGGGLGCSAQNFCEHQSAPRFSYTVNTFIKSMTFFVFYSVYLIIYL